jgi:hypothetical protein
VTFRAMCSVAKLRSPAVRVFCDQRFSLLGRNEACQFRNQKAERWLSGMQELGHVQTTRGRDWGLVLGVPDNYRKG